MTKSSKFAAIGIRKITGGRDPVVMVEDFIVKLGFDPAKCKKDQTPDLKRWMLAISEGEELELLLEGLRQPNESTVYMGINVMPVPIRGADEVLAAALEVADGLVGVKVSLVGHYLVMSAGLPTAGLSVDELEYFYKLIIAQLPWFKEAVAEELDWETQAT